jgi:ATP-dependent DNA helicase RecG
MPDMDPGWMPPDVASRLELPRLTESYFTIHNPKNEESVGLARKRVVMESLLLLETGLLRQRAVFKSQTAQAVSNAMDSSKEFFSRLQFKPTNAQERSRIEIAKDLESGLPMNRLLHGDVGSGKTVVGFSAVKAVMDAGLQAAWIAPTEVLATQTFKNAKKYFGDDVLYLSGSTKKNNRSEILRLLSTCRPCCVIGTHAVLEDWIEFPGLALCVVDEQHRFGVMQRARLAKKGKSPHILVMSATPIPRTLAMTLYGDLDVSAIDEMPEGRIPIVTKVCVGSDAQAYKRALSEIACGFKAYVVCPLVEESEKLEAKSAVEHFEELRTTRFKDIPCGLLHGRMKPAEKDEVMKSFAEGGIKVLISTTVIEVGIDVPDATVMIVENAERFGLAQLHQLRGRVGRGKDQSYCFLVTEKPAQAMMILERTANGLEVAEEDLKIRGPGDIGGTQQAGTPTLEVAPLLTPANLPLLTLARREAEAILAADPELTLPENARLKEGISRYMARHTGFAWVS